MTTVVRVILSLFKHHGNRRGVIHTHTRNDLGGRHIDLKIESGEVLEKELGIIDSEGKTVTVRGMTRQNLLERYRAYYHAEAEPDGTLRLLRRATAEEYLHSLPLGEKKVKTFVM